MRKVEIGNYLNQTRNAAGNLVPVPYNVKESMVNCLLHPVLKLTGRELLLRGKLVTQIEEAEIKEGKGHILIEEADYAKLKKAFETIEGFSKVDMELVRRVLEAEETDVEEVKNGGDKKPVKGRREK